MYGTRFYFDEINDWWNFHLIYVFKWAKYSWKGWPKDNTHILHMNWLNSCEVLILLCMQQWASFMCVQISKWTGVFVSSFLAWILNYVSPVFAWYVWFFFSEPTSWQWQGWSVAHASLGQLSLAFCGTRFWYLVWIACILPVALFLFSSILK
jgi:hypothetical protein